VTADERAMRLRILLPTELLVDCEVAKIVVEAPNGWFCMLPRHIDFVSALVPSILIFTTGAGDEKYVAIDEGTLVKRGRDVLVSVTNGVAGDDLGVLHEAVEATFRALDDEARAARTALARLEAGALRRFLEFERQHHD
jgi:F-type H+-transporting ATPase subunit epsilon